MVFQDFVAGGLQEHKQGRKSDDAKQKLPYVVVRRVVVRLETEFVFGFEGGYGCCLFRSDVFPFGNDQLSTGVALGRSMDLGETQYNFNGENEIE